MLQYKLQSQIYLTFEMSHFHGLGTNTKKGPRYEILPTNAAVTWINRPFKYENMFQFTLLLSVNMEYNQFNLSPI